jgi:hypothetical protein
MTKPKLTPELQLRAELLDRTFLACQDVSAFVDELCMAPVERQKLAAVLRELQVKLVGEVLRIHPDIVRSDNGKYVHRKHYRAPVAKLVRPEQTSTDK